MGKLHKTAKNPDMEIEPGSSSSSNLETLNQRALTRDAQWNNREQQTAKNLDMEIGPGSSSSSSSSNLETLNQ